MREMLRILSGQACPAERKCRRQGRHALRGGRCQTVHISSLVQTGTNSTINQHLSRAQTSRLRLPCARSFLTDTLDTTSQYCDKISVLNIQSGIRGSCSSLSEMSIRPIWRTKASCFWCGSAFINPSAGIPVAGIQLILSRSS